VHFALYLTAYSRFDGQRGLLRSGSNLSGDCDGGAHYAAVSGLCGAVSGPIRIAERRHEPAYIDPP
jgi:hypothetical protein